MQNKKLLGGATGILFLVILLFVSFNHVLRIEGNQACPDDPCYEKNNVPAYIYNLFCEIKRGGQAPPLESHLETILEQKNVIPIVVLGSGPAGLSAALYGSRAKIRTLVISGDHPGGQLMETTHIENWPGKKRALASDTMAELKSQALSFGAEFLRGSIERVDFTTWPYKLWTDSGKEINALTVVIATGASPRRLQIPGEEEFWGTGVTACAICDAPFYKNKNVIVVGGGDSAVEEVSILSSYAKEVVLLVRKDKMRAAATMQKRLEKLPNVSIRYFSEPREILGDSNGVKALRIFDSSQKKLVDINIDGVFLAIGHEPNTSLFSSILQLTDHKFIKLLGRTQRTTVPGIFAAGDVADEKYRQAGKAAGDGIAAALDAIEFLNNIGYTLDLSQKLTRSSGILFEGEESLVKEITSYQEFKSEILGGPDMSAVLAISKTCPSCPEAQRAFELTSHRFEGRVNFYTFDADDVKDIVQDKRVLAQKTPCLLLYKDGKLLARNYTLSDKYELYDFIDTIRD
ncbi:MAG TPA: FAD-dependent oxidoreductase [Candidatus Babeliales bacterium]|nr:FAD-dependent oxidoreductase [Candidatus Babeliales bacterium]